MQNPLILLRQLLANSTQKEIAQQLGVSQQYLSDVLNDRKAPGKAILDALGLERRVTYHWKRGKS